MSDDEEVRAQFAAWVDAIARRDVAAAEQILGEEYALMATGIGTMPRAQWLALKRGGRWQVVARHTSFT